MNSYDCLREISARSNSGTKVISIIRDENLTTLLFGAAVEAAKSNRRNIIFNPIPPTFVKFTDRDHMSDLTNEYIELITDISCRRSMDKFDALVTENLKNYKLLDKMLKQINSVSEYVSNVRELYDEFLPENDDEFRKKILESLEDKTKILLFDFMRFAIINNKLTLQRNDIVIGDPTKIVNDVVNKKHVHKFHQYEVIHTREVELEFDVKRKKAGGSCFLFHGSGKQNWYSLMSNGIKVASGTKLMTTGAAYGPGVYASNTLAVSFGYSGHTPSAKDDDANDLTKNQIVAVYEIIGNENTYMKTNAIYVIPDDSLLIIRYLLAIPTESYSVIVNNETSKGILDSIKSRNAVIQKNFTRFMVGWRRRIADEVKKANLNPAIKVYITGDVKTRYNPKIHNIKKILKGNGGAPYNIKFIFEIGGKDIEVRFPLDFPTSAPVITNHEIHAKWELQSNLANYMLN